MSLSISPRATIAVIDSAEAYITIAASQFKQLLLSNSILPDSTVRYKVLGNRDLSDSLGLTSLPVGLRLVGNLKLFCCNGLVFLPPGLQVTGNLDLFNCTRLVIMTFNSTDDTFVALSFE